MSTEQVQVTAQHQAEAQVHESTRLSKRRFGSSAWILGCLGGGGLLLAVLLAWGYWELGSFANIVAYANGERLLVDPKVLSFGSAPREEERELHVTIHNRTGKPVTVLGAQSKCGCLKLEDEFPFSIAKGGQKVLTIRVWPTGDNAKFERDIAFFTDDDASPLITLSVRGEILN